LPVRRLSGFDHGFEAGQDLRAAVADRFEGGAPGAGYLSRVLRTRFEPSSSTD
jgi:hypothetical protein